MRLAHYSKLLPHGIPRQIRCYDNGGDTIDRYTVVFTGAPSTTYQNGRRSYPYLAMNGCPFHPQGFGQHGDTLDRPCDLDDFGRVTRMGRSNHLGKRIDFRDLPPDCQRLVLADYREIWQLDAAITTF